MKRLTLFLILCPLLLNAQFYFEEIINSGLPQVSQGATDTADIDNDGDIDIFITGNYLGNYIAKLYLNDGNGIFSESVVNSFEGVTVSSVKFFDADNDNDLDVLYMGFDNSLNRITKLYLNDGLGLFTEDTKNTFSGISRGDITVGDIDNDNDNDILLTGEIGSTGLTSLYLNNGTGVFNLIENHGLPTIFASNCEFNDVDNDNDLDLLLTGGTTNGYTSKLFTNNGSGIFTENQNHQFKGSVFSGIHFVDVNNDTYDDVIITGRISNDFSSISELHINSGNGSFYLAQNFNFNVENGPIDSSDFNNDGYEDIIITGYYYASQAAITNFYLNNGNGSFSLYQNQAFSGINDTKSKLLDDIDGDGDDDLFLFGNNSLGDVSGHVYRNIEFDVENHPDYNALVAIYNNLNGIDWTNNTNWLDTTKPISSWYGITETNGRITSIDLSSNNVIGTLPDELTNLTELEIFWLIDGYISGEIPSNIGNLTKLKQLVLYYTYGITGSIPLSIQNCTNLEWLYLSGNQLSGDIPDLTGLTNLNSLFIDNNNFQYGDIEDEFVAYQNQITTFAYIPQNLPYIEPDNRVVNLGDDLSFNSLPISGNYNIYNWYLNDELIDTTTHTNITGLNTPNIQIENITENQLGKYECRVTNSIITGVYIPSGILNVGLNPQLHPDYDALVAIYNSLNGENWTHNTNWLDNSKHINSWYGITETNGRITSIDLSSNNVIGTLPDELTNLTELENFWLIDGYISGELPSNIGNLTKLKQLVLYYTYGITGSIPLSIQNCTNLEWLYLSGNQLSGDIPDLTGLTNLNTFYINNNNFQFGDFENEFAAYSDNIGSGFNYTPQNLIGEPYSEVLEIGNSIVLNTNVSGSQNSYNWYRINADGSEGNLIGSGENITITINTADDYKWNYYYIASSSLVPDLTLRSYYITFGDLPSNNPDYDALLAIYNSTNGNNWNNNTNWLDNTKALSSWYGVILENNRVIQLNLGSNNLTGSLPPEIGDLPELLNLNLWSNQLTGNIPPEIGNLTKLTYMDLAPNTFSGSIPSEIGNLVNLETLWLNQNGLTGSVPSSFQNLTKLRYLYLMGSVSPNSEFSSSAFSGDFPDLTALPLELLWIQNNYFQFTDIADEFETYKANIPDFIFNPQYTIDAPLESGIGIGDDITLTLTDVPTVSKNMLTKSSLVGNIYQWYKDGVALTINANLDTYTITNAQVSDSGIYHCEITNADVPDLIIRRQNITLNVGSLNTEEKTDDRVKIYPNPTKNILNIKLKNYNNAQVNIYDLNGRVVLKQNLTSDISVIDIQKLNSGLYLLKMNTKNKTITKRIIKQ